MESLRTMDSYEVIKTPRIPCYGWCGRELKHEIVVLEHKPTSTLLFFCSNCASNRIILDAVAERIENGLSAFSMPVELVRDIDIGDGEVPNIDRKVARQIRANTHVPARTSAHYGNHSEIYELALINEGYRYGYVDSVKRRQGSDGD